MDLLVVKQVGRLQESLITQVTLEGTICGIFVRATVAHQGVLLFEAHLAFLALKRPFLRVGAFMLPQVRWTFEAFSTRATAEGPLPYRLALVVQELRRLLKVHLTQIALEKVLTRMGVHVAHKVRAVLEAFLTDRTLVWPLRTVSALVVGQMRRLAEAFITRVTFVWLLTCVYSFMAGQL